MIEDPRLIRHSISHYQELLKLRRVAATHGAVEHRLVNLLEEALAELSLAEVAARDGDNLSPPRICLNPPPVVRNRALADPGTPVLSTSAK
jgi:hypothetical protein